MTSHVEPRVMVCCGEVEGEVYLINDRGGAGRRPTGLLYCDGHFLFQEKEQRRVICVGGLVRIACTQA